jgi:hypothetical protein
MQVGVFVGISTFWWLAADFFVCRLERDWILFTPADPARQE